MPQVAHKIHNHQRPRLQVLNNYDPTRTTTLRTQFAAEMGRRFRALRGIIRKAIIDQNCFGLTRQDELYLLPSAYGAMTLPGHNAFAFPRSSDKVEGFMEWLGQQQEIGILEMPGSQIGRGVEQAWTNKYIQSSYQKGIVRARQELRKAGYRSRAGDEIPALETGGQISAAFNQPFHADRVGLLYSRTFSDLKGITAAMDTQISRVLAQGIADGLPPRQIAKLLTRTISGPVGGLGITDTLGRFIPAERRAKILARTEIIRAHHSATIQEYKNWGAEGVTVRAEWTTAGDGRVCADCAALEGKEFSLAQIESKIPLHPQCRCLALPLDMTGKEKAPPIESKISNEEFRKLEDASTKDVFNYGEKNGKEKLIAISDSGQIRSATGAYEEVGFSTKVQREIDGWNNVTVVHNHPLEQTFSTGDIVQFGDLPGFRRGLITRPSGQIDELFKPSGVVFDRRKASSVLARQREILVDDFMDLVTSGTMTKEVALERSLIQALEENGLKFNHRKTPTIPTIKKPLKTPVEIEADAKTAWEAAKKESALAQAEARWGGSGLYAKEQKAYYDYVKVMNPALYQETRQSILKKMVKIEGKSTLTKDQLAKFEQGTNWVPFDVLNGLESSGLKVQVFPSPSLRANYSQDLVSLSKTDGVNIIAHETAHAVDDFFGLNKHAGRDLRSADGGFIWDDNQFVSKTNAISLKEEYKSIRSGEKGIYKNGDGAYWKDNWINNYEGRIYNRGIGHEWWAMNNQRFSKYQNAGVKFDKTIENYTKDIKRLQGKEDLIVGHLKGQIKKMTDEGRDTWAARTSKWDKARERYPELSSFIEEKFGVDKRIMGDWK